ncbi:MAG: RNA-binding S4 domain-containing protein [Candidatus Aegiribacteria sp.]|nr:RNA-binding S4 domain-containing protein [Candidatus Aegiribacteria sp.]
MRIDVYLKLMGIFKTRSIAGKACKAGCISIDDLAVKSSCSVKKGDLIKIVKPDDSEISVFVLEIPSKKQVPRKDRQDYCRIVGMEG